MPISPTDPSGAPPTPDSDANGRVQNDSAPLGAPPNPASAPGAGDRYETAGAPNGPFTDPGTPSGNPDDGDAGDGAVTSRAAAAGRYQFVESQARQAYRLGQNAPLTRYDGDVYRAVPTSRDATYADHTYSGGGRYNQSGQSVIYNSETRPGIIGELTLNYGGVEDHSLIRSHLSADLADATTLSGLSPDALTVPFGQDGIHTPSEYRWLGEDPYQIPRAFGDGVRGQGGAGIRVPARGGFTHVNVFPENVPGMAADYRYSSQWDVDSSGVIGPESRNPAVVPPPPGATPNRNLGDIDKALDDARLHQRGGGLRYGAAAGALTSSVEAVLAGDLSTDAAWTVAGSTVVGGGSAYLDDGIRNVLGGSPRAGFVSGGIVDGLTSAGFSTWNNADAFDAGQISAGDATADVAVDTSIGVASGLSGAAIGAGVGSVIPIAGTAAGAVIGFGVGMVASWGTHELLEGSGVGDWAREGLGDFLDENFSAPLESAWETIGDAQDAIADFGSDVVEGAGNLVDGAVDLGGDAIDGAIELGGDIVDGVTGFFGSLF